MRRSLKETGKSKKKNYRTVRDLSSGQRFPQILGQVVALPDAGLHNQADVPYRGLGKLGDNPRGNFSTF